MCLSSLVSANFEHLKSDAAFRELRPGELDATGRKIARVRNGAQKYPQQPQSGTRLIPSAPPSPKRLQSDARPTA